MLKSSAGRRSFGIAFVVVAGTGVIALFARGRHSPIRPTAGVASPTAASSGAGTTGELPRPRGPEPVERVSERLAELDALPKGDQAGLDRLYEAMRASIAERPSELHDYLQAHLGDIDDMPLAHTFFLVKSYVRHHPEPAPLVASLLARPSQPRHEDGAHAESVHHVDRYDHLAMTKAHALQLWRERYEQGEISETARTVLLPVTVTTGRQDADLSVVREALRVAIAIAGPGSAAAQSIAEARRSAERFAISDLVPAR